MPTTNTIPYYKYINNLFLVLELTLYLTIPYQEHFYEFIFVSIRKVTYLCYY